MVDGEPRLYPDYPGIARRYCEMVVSRELDVCLYVRQACDRYLKMLAAAGKPGTPYYFSPEWACDVCDFFDKMPRSKGGRPGALLVCQPYQIWEFCAIFGFRRDDPVFPETHGMRLVRDVYLEEPRGSGKSERLAVIALYCFTCESEEGSQIFIGAPKEDLAKKVFEPIKAMIDKTPDLKDHFGLGITVKRVTKAGDRSAQITMVSSISEREDGHDPHVVIMEELHSQDEGLYRVMQSSLGKRTNNLFVSITTAGLRASGVCWRVRDRLINTLAGRNLEPSFFGVIFTVDAEDVEDERNLAKPETWRKANPMWGISLDPSSIHEAWGKAKNTSPADIIEFYRTRLNHWTNANGGLIFPEHWKACFNPKLKLDDFRGATCWIGADLGSKNDLTAIGIIFARGRRIQIFNRYFIPERAAGFGKESVGAMYRGWVDQGWLTTTPGAVTDYGFVEVAIREWCEKFDPLAIVFDKYQSNQILSALYNDGLPAIQMNPGTMAVSDPAKDFLAHIEAGTLEHDGNPVTEWMAMNVVGHLDKRGNILPQKEDPNSDNKIDGIAALIEANAVRLDTMLDIKPKRRPSAYNARGGALFSLDGPANERVADEGTGAGALA